MTKKIIKHFTVDAKTVLTLGRDSIRNHTTALLELVKNSYDADATIVDVEIGDDFIRISDNGCGMSSRDITNNWLRIGFSEKKNKKISKKRRRKTGEKGVGRLSADRLGKHLEITTRAKSHNPIQIKVNWENFNAKGKEVKEIPIEYSEISKINVPESKSGSGTEIIIKQLRQDWLEADIENMYDELSTLLSPFDKKNDFKINFKNSLTVDLNGYIQSPYFEAADIIVKAKYIPNKNEVSYEILDKQNRGRQKVKKVKVKWNKISHVVDPFNKIQDANKLECGPVMVSFLFYSRTTSHLLSEEGLNLRKLKSYLDKNAGIKIYRDNVSVKPYGYNNDDNSDWLNLAERKARNPAGLSRKSYKVSAHQIVGAIDVGRDKNPKLRDSTSREGLVKNNAFYNLRAFSLACIGVLENYRHEEHVKTREAEKGKTQSIVSEVKEFKDDLNSFEKDLGDVKELLEKTESKEEVQEFYEKVSDFITKTKEASKNVGELLDHNRVLGGLSTIGIASAVFGHETQSSISGFKSSAILSHRALNLKKGPNIKMANRELEKALRMAERVAAWGAFALIRIRRDKRTKKKIHIDKVIDKILDDISGIFNAVGIKLNRKLDSIEIKIFEMDIETIIINLLTNAYCACLDGDFREIDVILKKEKKVGKDGFEIVVSDSGPGVNKSIEKIMWEPLVTNKIDKKGKEIGTGLGLSIISSIVKDLGGEKKMCRDKRLKGACFSIWIPNK